MNGSDKDEQASHPHEPTTMRLPGISDLYAPLAGEVTAVNDALDATPELVNTDPYGEGWMYELRPSDSAAVDALLDHAAYQAQLG